MGNSQTFIRGHSGMWKKPARIQFRESKSELVEEEDLLLELMELPEVELWRVQWCLSHVLWQNFPPIPPHWLQSADAESTAKIMLKCYHLEGALTILDAALAVIGRHDLVHHRLPEPPCHKLAPKPNPDFLKTQRGKLICWTQKLDVVMDVLQDNGILEAANRDAINIHAVQMEKNRALVDLLLKKGQEAQEVFYEGLSQSDPFLVQELQEGPISNERPSHIAEHSELSVLRDTSDFLVLDEAESLHPIDDDNPRKQRILGTTLESNALNVEQKIVPAFREAETLPRWSSDTGVETNVNLSVVEITPEVYEDGDMFRLRCHEPGIFRCRLTGLLLEGVGDLVYQIIPWDVGFLSSKGLRPAGPLFRFTLLTGRFHQLHLPHCQQRSGGGPSVLSVAHITEESLDFITPGLVTDSHVIIDICGFSCFGLVVPEASHAVISGLVLVFFCQSPHSLFILLLPRNICLTQVTKEWKRRNGAEYVETIPYCELIPNQTYKLSGQPVTLIQPETSKFLNFNDYTNFLPSFQVQMETHVGAVELQLSSHVTGLPLIGWLFGSRESVVWNQFVQLRVAVSDLRTEVTLDTTLRLVDVLNDFRAEDLKTFQRLLSLQSDPIPVSRLEGADCTRTVDLMIQQYHSEGAKELTEEILRRMKYNQLADRLLKN